MAMPKFYGEAWYDYQHRERIAYPIPFNWVVAIARTVWFWLKRPFWLEDLRRRIQKLDDLERSLELNYSTAKWLERMRQKYDE